ncbi:MAG: hypothetical protein BWX70_00666 [Verrucomicrobia bacterium ADurb.Bin070]|nr:MAG: hypothetical protein BWX70_00666 [Verrucomicrobia bacterium ADurb.Bin070]
MEKSVILILAAHLIGDFPLQPDWLAEKKKSNLRYLILHAVLQGALAYLAFQVWRCWQLPCLVALSHALIDALKRRSSDTSATFVIDQALHAAFLSGIVFCLQSYALLPAYRGIGYSVIVVSGGFAATVIGAGFFIGKFMKRLIEGSGLNLNGLANAGKWIGQLERALIFIFVLVGYLEGVGFLVAAKSILRFKETEEQKMAEYVLVGTLLSFFLAIALASATKWAMKL